MNDKNINRNRWASLENNINNTILRIDAGHFSQDVTIKSLLMALKAFAKSQFDFFNNGFYGEVDANGNIAREPYLEESREFLPEYILRKTLYQIEYDLSVIKQAIDQRKNGSDAEKNALKQADVLAYLALIPAIDGAVGLLEKTAVVTYFSKVASVRVIPYAPVALIGLPYSAIDVLIDGMAIEAVAPPNTYANARDFLAIPHEIGHYVYWHGRLGNSRLPTTLSNRLRKLPKWLENWLEEVFADIYGALIVGPTMALNFQELQKDFFEPSKFMEDDQQHPIPAIRPYIYTNILNKVEFEGKKPFEKLAEDLDSLWKAWLENYDIPKEFAPKGKNEVIKIEDLLVQLEKVITVAYKSVRLDKLRKDLGSFWSNGNDGIGSLFSQFVAFLKSIDFDQEVQNLPKVIIENIQGKDILKIDDQEWAELGKTGLAIDALKDGVQNGSRIQYKMLPEAWLIVFSMRRWTVAGPTGNPPVGG